MDLKYVVVTSVTRDDLLYGRAGFFAETIRALRNRIAGVRVEVLIPDFQGDLKALEKVIRASPDVLNHNVETVPGLYPKARPRADYRRSIELLSNAAFMDTTIPVKSGMILGLSETDDKIKKVFKGIATAGCRIVTLGQYLKPSKKYLPVARAVCPARGI